jgi:hypothetical protein
VVSLKEKSNGQEESKEEENHKEEGHKEEGQEEGQEESQEENGEEEKVVATFRWQPAWMHRPQTGRYESWFPGSAATDSGGGQAR